MPQPQPRNNVMANAMQELERMEARRNSINRLDELRLSKCLNSLDQSIEGVTARHALQALWDRNFQAYDEEAKKFLQMGYVGHRYGVLANFALCSSRALNPSLALLLNRQAFEAGKEVPDLLLHIFDNAFRCGDIWLGGEALAQMDKLGVVVPANAREGYNSVVEILESNSCTPDEYHEHLCEVSKIIRSYIQYRKDVRATHDISVSCFESDYRELLLEVELDLESETLDQLDEELLNFQCDINKVSPALNKSLGVLIRDYPEEESAEAC